MLGFAHQDQEAEDTEFGVCARVDHTTTTTIWIQLVHPSNGRHESGHSGVCALLFFYNKTHRQKSKSSLCWVEWSGHANLSPKCVAWQWKSVCALAGDKGFSLRLHDIRHQNLWWNYRGCEPPSRQALTTPHFQTNHHHHRQCEDSVEHTTLRPRLGQCQCRLTQSLLVDGLLKQYITGKESERTNQRQENQRRALRVWRRANLW